VESVIFDDTTVYNRYFEVPGGAMWLHLGTVFLGVCQERPFYGFWMFFGCPGIPF
jgi:hypothetical protein